MVGRGPQRRIEVPERLARAAVACLLGSCAAATPAAAVELFDSTVVVLPVGFPDGIDVADFNADGIDDLVVFDGADEGVVVFLADGLGGFARMPLVPVDVSSMVATDFDGDGAVDLAVSRFGGVILLRGDGRGGFAGPVSVLSPYAGGLVTADFDADGVPDLAVTHQDGTTILLGDGFGGFLHANDLPLSPARVIVADLDLDGAQDLIRFSFSGTDASVHFGDGHGGFPRSSALPFAGRLMVAADFDGDGAQDLAVGGPSLTLHLGNGLGGFAPALDLGPSAGPMVTADFDGNGSVDLAVPGTGVFLADGSGGYALVPGLTLGASAVAVGDFNADGVYDLAVNGDRLRVYFGDGLGGFGAAPGIATGAWNGSAQFAVGDLDRDGAQDLVLAGQPAGVLLGDGIGSFVPLAGAVPGTGSLLVALGDFDGDGLLDLVDGGQLYRGDGNGAFDAGEPIDGALDTVTTLLPGDFNADGALDLAVGGRRGSPPDNYRLTVLLGDGRAGFTLAADLGVDAAPLRLARGDFNADGFPDVAAVIREQRGLEILLGSSSGNFALAPDPPRVAEPYGHWTHVAAGDLDGDGIADLAATTSFGTMYVFPGGRGTGLGPGSSFFTGVYTSDSNWDSMTIGDLNADGAADLIILDSLDSAVWVFLGDGHGGFTQEFPLDSRYAGSLAVARIDGDGLPDIVLRGSTSLYVLANQLALRADVNGSNRIDGFDVAAIGLRAGARRCAALPPCASAYRRDVDANLDGAIDGDDLALVAGRFGQLNRALSPLRATVVPVGPPGPRTVTIQQGAQQGDLLTVEIVVNDDDPVASANFALAFGPLPGDADRAQVLEVVGFEAGSYLSGGPMQLVGLDTTLPGLARVSISRFPNEDRTGGGAQPLIGLILRARRAGQAVLDFAPDGWTSPVLLSASGQAIPGTRFEGGALVEVSASGGGPPGQRFAFFPEELDFGEVAAGAAARRALRLSNFGFSEVTITAVRSTLPEFGSFFESPFAIPAFGYVSLPVAFASSAPGVYSGELEIESDDAQRPLVRVRLVARAGGGLAITPGRMDFGNVAEGGSRTLALRATNRAAGDLTLADFRSSDARVAVLPRFTELPVGVSGIVDVTFAPPQPGELRGRLDLTFDGAPGRSVVLPLSGRGEPDPDRDGVFDRRDNCPLIPNPDQIDTDRDGLGDACDGCPLDADNDVDGDGVCADTDNCPLAANASQADLDADGRGDACDNCPLAANADQVDSDGDGAGDACDVCIAVADADQADGDGDGVGDACDNCPSAANPGQTDFDEPGAFGPRRGITTEADGADSVFAADLDGDGDADVVAASGDGKTAWYENLDGAGGFGPQRVLPAPPVWDPANAVFTGDLDGDGDPDVVTTTSNGFRWSENLDGRGTFATARRVVAGLVGALSGAAADLDGDGDLDVLAGHYLQNTVAWYPNTDGAGTFGPPRAIATDAVGVRSVDAADLDGDGDLDVLAAGGAVQLPGSEGEISWYANLDGAGNFGPKRVVASGTGLVDSVAAVDLDGDGDRDILSASLSGDYVSWYENLGGVFGPRQVISYVAASSALASDLDGDGDPDVLTAHPYVVAWYENRGGARSFGPQRLIDTTADGTYQAFAADLDGDGLPDVLSASQNSDTIAWQRNGGDDAGDACDNCPGLYNPGQQDLDGDGTGDACDACSDSDGDGWGDPGAPGNTCAADNCPAAWNPDQADLDRDGVGDACDDCPAASDPGQADADGDGIGDVCDDCPAIADPDQADADGDSVGDACDDCPLDAANDGDGDGFCPDEDNCPVTSNPDQQDADADGLGDSCDNCPADANPDQADTDGDPRHLVVLNRLGASASVLFGDGRGGFASIREAALGGQPTAAALADFDEDGHVDLAVAIAAANSVVILLGDGQGGLAALRSVATGQGPLALTGGDLDGDGHADLAVAGFTGSVVSVLLGDGRGGFARTDYPSSLPYGVTRDDLDGDGDADLVVTSFLTDTVSVLAGNGRGGFTLAATFNVGRAPLSPVTVDFDGDGSRDIAVANSGSNSLNVLLGDGAGGFTAAPFVALGAAPNFLATGDLNRDGVPDLVATSASDHSLRVLPGDGLGGFGPPALLGVGTDPTSVAIADFDGDGNPDLAVTNRAGDALIVYLGDGRGGFGPPQNVSVGDGPVLVLFGLDLPDGAGDVCDNCPAVFNPGQEDADGDGIGDACDAR